MQTTFGQFNPDGGVHLLRAVNYPELARMDEATPDGRTLVATGGSTRTLPVAIMAQFETLPGHMGATVVGTLQEVTLNDDGVVSGKGWLLDTAEGQKMEILLEAQALRQNSVDLADIEYEIEWASDDIDSPDFWNYTVNFTQWKIATTTFVNVPAFPEAHGEVTASFDRSVPLVVNCAETIITLSLNEDEVTASGAATVPFEDFHRPEPREKQPFTIDANGVITGHLAEWNKCHDGIEGRCQLAPRPNDYSGFHEPGVLTDRGIVETGPIFLLGGHPGKPLGRGDRWAAYGGVENAVGDVRVINGVIGPWMSGRVRPGISHESVYAARASRVSGHWRRDSSLAAIVCVNVPGYKVPGSTLSWDRDGGIVSDGELVELVASLRADPFDAHSMREEIEAGIDKVLGAGTVSMTWQPPTMTMTNTNGTSGSIHTTVTQVEFTDELTVEVEVEDEPDPEAEAAALILELELQAHLPLKR